MHKRSTVSTYPLDIRTDECGEQFLLIASVDHDHLTLDFFFILTIITPFYTLNKAFNQLSLPEQ